MERLQNRRSTGGIGLVLVGFGALVALLLLLALNTWGATPKPITPGITFVSGQQNITHTDLNKIAGDATIGTTFITGQTLTTASTSSDFILLVRSGSYFQGSLPNLIFDSSNLVSNRTEETSIVTNDYVLVFDTSATAHRKARIDNLISNTMATPPPIGQTTPAAAWFTTMTNTGAATISGATTIGGQLVVSNAAYFYGVGNSFISNVTILGHTVMGTDSNNLVTFNGKLAGTWTGGPTVSLTNVTMDSTIDKVLIKDATDGLLKMATLSTSSKATFTNAVPAAGSAITNAHGLSAVPDLIRVTLLVTNAVLNYSVGDEIAAWADQRSDVEQQRMSVVSSTTNVVVVFNNSGSDVVSIMNKGTGAYASAGKTNFNVVTRCVVIP